MVIIGKLQAKFVAERAVLRASEVAFGFERGLLSAKAVVDLEMLYLESGVGLTALELDLACVLNDELSRVGEILAALDQDEVQDSQRVWIFLIIDALGQSEHSLDKLLSLVEEVWSSWDHPKPLYDIIWPPPERNPSTFAVDAGAAELKRYLSKEREYFRNRDIIGITRKPP